jgi:hypothetical protein
MSKNILNLSVLQSKVNEVQLEALLETVDRLHSAAAQGDLQSATELSPELVAGWLEDIMFTAQEAINEIHRSASQADAVEDISPTQRRTVVTPRLYRKA